MRSNNPVFQRAEGFNAPTFNAYGNATYAGNGQTHEGFGTSVPGVGAPYASTAPTRAMTIDSVVRASAVSLAVVIAAAVATWLLTPAITTDALGGSSTNLQPLVAALVLGGGAAFILSMVNSFKRTVSPALVLIFAAAEGVALGAFSKLIDAQFAGGIVVQAVIGTFAAFAGTLAAYKFLNIKVGAKFRTFVIAAMFGMVGLGLIDLVLGLFGTHTGLFGFGALGLLTAVGGLVLGVFMLILDFDEIENGIRNGLPESESWRAAFGLTVSLVWIYQNLLRILAILRD